MVYFSSSGSVVITIVISACHQDTATSHPTHHQLRHIDEVGATGIRNLESGTSNWRIVKIIFNWLILHLKSWIKDQINLE